MKYRRSTVFSLRVRAMRLARLDGERLGSGLGRVTGWHFRKEPFNYG